LTQFWRDILARVMAGLIVAGLTAKIGSVYGWWPPIWHGIEQAAAAVRSALVYSVPVPLTAIAALLAAILIANRAHLRARDRVATLMAELAKPPPRPSPQPVRREIVIGGPFEPDDVQERILRALAQLDGEPLHPRDLVSIVNVGRLIVDQALQGLEKRGMIRRWEAGYGGKSRHRPRPTRARLRD
jgi:hypothetical protein